MSRFLRHSGRILGLGAFAAVSLSMRYLPPFQPILSPFNVFETRKLHCDSFLWRSSAKSAKCECGKQRNFIADAAEKVLDSVVNIMLETEVSDMFSSKVVCSRGSGFIVSKEGLVLTNAHVVQDFTDKSKIIVTLTDGREYPGHIHAVDFLSDLAIIKIVPELDQDIPELKPVLLGSETEMRFEVFENFIDAKKKMKRVSSNKELNTITVGVVSSQRRKSSEIGALDSRVEYLQTDCIIHSGSSGGPLINVDGEVIGINTIRADMEGISFAIKVNHSLEMIHQLMEFGKITRPYFGFGMVSLNPYVWQQLKVQTPSHLLPRTETGILITTIEPNSPAFYAGCMEGDVIVEVNGQGIHSASKVGFV
ncbi:UNVERIFIED_CONTAM: Serine protease htra2, mitochondrial [Siphonaria sp. JEL0065]|nr:Serine protease htra2, mitochondrial [Siphonaria sp. JEL0065]